MAGSSGNSATLEIDGRPLRLSNLDKVLYPDTGFTKAQVIDYYVRMAPVLLPHIAGRPLSLKRYPDGVDGEAFFQKECPAHAPDWLPTVPVWSDTDRRHVDYCTAASLADLVYLANLANLEVHTYLARAKAPDQPTALVFDLDPGPDRDLLHCTALGLVLRGLLSDDGLDAYPKVSGSKGLHVYVPLNGKATFTQTKSYAKAMAEALQKAHPADVTANMSKAVRGSRVFIDWSQNDRHKTTVCAYSLRGTAKPSVSVPVSWEELEAGLRAKDAARLRFTPVQAQERVERLGDLFQPVLEQKQRLPRRPPAAA